MNKNDIAADSSHPPSTPTPAQSLCAVSEVCEVCEVCHETFSLLGTSPQDDDPSIEDILEQYDFEFILAHVKRMVHLHPEGVHPDMLHMELEDIAQDVSINFWQKLRKQHIQNPRLYLLQMIHNKCVDVIRRQARRINAQPLSVIDDWDILERIAAHSEGMSDPADEFAQKTTLAERTGEVADAVARLPLQQQRVMTFTLLERVDNLIQLVEALSARNINTNEDWPENKNEARLLKASLPHARKALAKHMNIDLSPNKQTKPRPSTT